MSTVIEIQSLYKIFGQSPAKILRQLSTQDMDKSSALKLTGHTIGLKDINLNIKKGEIFVVMGLSGSGKSTLIRCLNRLIEPTSGKILLNGQDILTMNQQQLNQIRGTGMAMVFQSFALLPHKNIVDNVAFGLELRGIKKEERRQKATEILSTVGLAGYGEAMPSELSGGMQQRVGLARALCTEPEILLMDEAFSALDPLIRAEMQDELISLQLSLRKTIVFITHDLDEALKLGDRIAIMKDGELIQVGTPEQILNSPANDYVKSFVNNVNRAKVITASAIMKRSRHLTIPKEGLKSALKRMNDESISSLFVTDENKILQGIVTIDKVQEQLHSQNGTIDNIIDKNISTVSPDTIIDDILPLFLTNPYPVAVTETNGRLKGIVFKSSVIGGMIKEEN